MKNLELIKVFDRACREIGKADSVKLPCDYEIKFKYKNEVITEVLKKGTYIPDVTNKKLVAWCKLLWIVDRERLI